jgi:hypothetical protein
MISFSGTKLEVDGQSIETEYPIADAFEASGLVVVRYDPDVYTDSFGQFPNLVAFQFDGTKAWTAQLPTNGSGDRYHTISSRAPIVVQSFSCFACEIDPDTGRIVARRFTK